MFFSLFFCAAYLGISRDIMNVSVMKDRFIRDFWVSAGIIAAAIVFAFAGFWYVIGLVNAHADTIARYQSGVVTRNASFGAISSLEKNAPTAAAYQAAIVKLLPSQDGLLQFPRNLQMNAAAFNVAVQATFTGEPTPSSPGVAGSVPFSLSASGAQSDLLAFLKNIETQSPQFLVAIDSVDFTMTASSSAKLSASGRVFFQ